MIVMPLKHMNATVGVLKAMSCHPAKFTQAEAALLELLSEQVAAAMFFATKYDPQELFYRATHDPLTGVANRSLFMDRLRSEIAHGERGASLLGVLMIDMNGLKQINDTFGHRTGDAVIVEVSHRIAACARESDTVARLGGDEFGVILSPIDSMLGIESAIDRYSHAIAHPFLYENRAFPMSASIGGAVFPHDTDDINNLMEIADQRMYQIKKRHRDQQLRN